jgi:hypothetical protein
MDKLSLKSTHVLKSSKNISNQTALILGNCNNITRMNPAASKTAENIAFSSRKNAFRFRRNFQLHCVKKCAIIGEYRGKKQNQEDDL